jgi:hypothetical protein
MSSWILRLSIFLWSSSKFLVGTSMALAMLTPVEGWIWCMLGGISGCFLWIFAGNFLQNLWSKWFSKGKKSKTFSKKNRFIVRLRQKGGIYLIAFLTPMIISIPAGCLISISIENNVYRVLKIQSISVVFWSTLLFGGKYFFSGLF